MNSTAAPGTQQNCYNNLNSNHSRPAEPPEIHPDQWYQTPAYVMRNRKISWFDKALFAVINGLTGQKSYCYARNEYIAEILGVDKRTVQRGIEALNAEGFFNISYRGKPGNTRRYIKIASLDEDEVPHDSFTTPPDQTPWQNCHAPHGETVTLNNKDLITSSSKELKKADESEWNPVSLAEMEETRLYVPDEVVRETLSMQMNAQLGPALKGKPELAKVFWRKLGMDVYQEYEIQKAKGNPRTARAHAYMSFLASKMAPDIASAILKLDRAAEDSKSAALRRKRAEEGQLQGQEAARKAREAGRAPIPMRGIPQGKNPAHRPYVPVWREDEKPAEREARLNAQNRSLNTLTPASASLLGALTKQVRVA